jgi:hypothetical protein
MSAIGYVRVLPKLYGNWGLYLIERRGQPRRSKTPCWHYEYSTGKTFGINDATPNFKLQYHRLVWRLPVARASCFLFLLVCDLLAFPAGLFRCAGFGRFRPAGRPLRKDDSLERYQSMVPSERTFGSTLQCLVFTDLTAQTKTNVST